MTSPSKLLNIDSVFVKISPIVRYFFPLLHTNLIHHCVHVFSISLWCIEDKVVTCLYEHDTQDYGLDVIEFCLLLFRVEENLSNS